MRNHHHVEKGNQMNKGIRLLAVMGLMAAGCSDSTPGGPGAVASRDTTAEQRETVPTTPGAPRTPVSNESVTTVNRPTYGEADRTFEISTPVLSTRLKQGETKTVSIGISRGKNFDQDVTLNMSGVPEGVTINPTTPKVGHGDKDTEVSIQAAADAALGDFTINVVGHPETGADATTTLKLTVLEK